MARNKKKMERREIHITPERAAWLRKVAVHSVIGLAFIAALGTGFYYVRQYVTTEVTPARQAPTIVLKNRPHWMSDFLVQRLAAMARPKTVADAFDHDMLVEIRRRLAQNPWVSKVYSVRRVYGEQPGDILEIDCEYRAPVALVKWGENYWLVDRAGFKLPEQYDAADVPRIVTPKDGIVDIRIVEGVHHAPPLAGKKWLGEDLSAGLEMIALLADKAYAQDVLKVNVAHFGSAREPHVVLVTRFETEVRWGRTPSESEKDPFIEVSTATKLDYLKKIYTQFGRVDAGQIGGIDIRFDRVTYPSAEPAGELRTVAGGE